jgi:hypothetical protein
VVAFRVLATIQRYQCVCYEVRFAQTRVEQSVDDIEGEKVFEQLLGLVQVQKVGQLFYEKMRHFLFCFVVAFFYQMGLFKVVVLLFFFMNQMNQKKMDLLVLGFIV